MDTIDATRLADLGTLLAPHAPVGWHPEVRRVCALRPLRWNHPGRVAAWLAAEFDLRPAHEKPPGIPEIWHEPTDIFLAVDGLDVYPHRWWAIGPEGRWIQLQDEVDVFCGK